MAIEPYLFFNGRCEEAIEFYKKALGAEVLMLMRYKESPEPHAAGDGAAGLGEQDHARALRIGNANVMASDGCSEGTNFQGFSCRSRRPMRPKRSESSPPWPTAGRCRCRSAKTFWSPCFGMVADRFGVGWMVSVAGQTA